MNTMRPLNQRRILAALAAAWLLMSVSYSQSLPTGTVSIEDMLSQARSNLVAGRHYLVGFPAKGRNQLRQHYLGVNAEGATTGTPRFDYLQAALDLATAVRADTAGASPEQQETAQLIAWESLEAMLQGQVVAGNGNLLKGLRVAFPTAVGDGEKPGGEVRPPVSCPGPEPGAEYDGCKLIDLCYAREHFFRGIVSTLGFMAGDESGDIRVLDLANDPLSQYTKFGTPDLPDPNFTNQFSQTTAYLLGNVLDRYGKTIVAIGDRLWRAAYFKIGRSPAERADMLEKAMTNLQHAAHAQFLAVLPLAASVPEDDEGFVRCRLDQVRVTASSATTFIERIRKGEVPKLDDLNLDSSTSSIQRQHALVERIRQDVNEKYQRAETDIWRKKDAEAKIIEDAKQIRAQFIDQLYLATGLDPGAETAAPYFGLTTPSGRSQYRQAVVALAREMLRAKLESPLLTGGSELGQSVLQILRAKADVASARNRIDSIPAQIRIEEQRVGAINGVIKETAQTIGILQLSIGIANSISVSVSAGFPSGVSVSTTFNPGSIISGTLQSQITRAQAIQEMTINQINAAATVKNLLLQQHQYTLDLVSAAAQAQLAGANLAALRDRIDRLIETLGYYQEANEETWYYDPALVFDQESSEIDYDNALREYVREAYNLTQMLGVRWSEMFENPYLRSDGVPANLGVEQFDDFTQAESVFNIMEAREANNFSTALRLWDNKLRSERYGGELSRTSILSLRQDIFGFSDIVYNPTTRRFEINPDPAALARNRRQWSALILRHAEDPESRYWLRLEFPITYNQYSQSGRGSLLEQPPLILAPRAAWNLRVKEISAKFVGDNITQSADNTLFVQLSQHGKIEIPTYHPRSLSAYPNFLRFTLPLYFPDPAEDSISPFNFFIEAGINGFDGIPNQHVARVEPSPFCDRWVLLIERRANPPINLQNIEDILLTIKWESGMPPALLTP